MTKPSLNRYVLTDELYSLLKQQILAHTLPAGEKINIDKLTRELGVSNIPIREALFRLATEGFVNVVPFKGMYVAPLSLKDIDDIFEMRFHLEELAVRKATPRIPNEKLLQMLQSLTPQTGAAAPVQEDAGGNESESEMVRLNRDLHGTFLSYANNETLRNTVWSLIERIHRYLNLYHWSIDMDAERREHEAIVRSMMERDEDAAAEAVRAHLRHSCDRVRANFQ